MIVVTIAITLLVLTSVDVTVAISLTLMVKHATVCDIFIPWVTCIHDFDGMSHCIHTDIDECSGDAHSCEHICRNTEGSYICECHEGYELHHNRMSCQGLK